MFCIVSLSFAKFHCARICFWNPQREQATKRANEREGVVGRGRGAREASWLLLSFSVLLFPLLFICVLFVVVAAAVSQLCVLVRACVCLCVCVCGAHALWLWKINNNNEQMTLSCNFLCCCCCCCCGGPWLSNNDGTIHAHTHTYLCICMHYMCIFNKSTQI